MVLNSFDQGLQYKLLTNLVCYDSWRPAAAGQVDGLWISRLTNPRGASETTTAIYDEGRKPGSHF